MLHCEPWCDGRAKPNLKAFNYDSERGSFVRMDLHPNLAAWPSIASRRSVGKVEMQMISKAWVGLLLGVWLSANAAAASASPRRLTPASADTPRFRLAHHTDKKFDWMPDYSAVTTIEVRQSGRWSEIFQNVELRPDDVVRIAKEARVVFDVPENPRIRALVLQGTLTFAPDLVTRLTVGTLQITDGRLEIRPTTGRAGIRFHGELDLINDAGQYSVGLLATGGVVDIHGPAPKIYYSRLARGSAPGARELELSDAPDWRVGDRVLVSGARLVKSGAMENTLAVESEFGEVAGVAGSRVTLKRPLQFAHDEGVSHLSRRIRITSSETSPTRGHLLFTAQAKVLVEGVELEGLGRTLNSRLKDTRWNPDGTAAVVGTQQRGRYFLHAHHLVHPIQIADCVLFDRPTNRWAITLHASHGRVERNILVFPGGAGIVAENGFETGVIRRNVLIGGLGGAEGSSDLERGGLRGADGHYLEDRGWEGYGLWLRSPTFEVTENIAEGAFREAAYGFHCFEPDGELEATTFPNDPGRPPQVAGKALGDVWCRLKGIQVFAHNTNHAYIAREPSSGAALYLAHMFLHAPFVVENFTSRNSGKVLAYYSRSFEFSGMDLRGNADWAVKSPGFFFTGVSDVVVRDSVVRNCTVGLTPPLQALAVSRCLFDNAVNFEFMPGDADCPCHISLPGRVLTLSQVRFGPGSGTNIWMNAHDVESTRETDGAGQLNARGLAKMLSPQTRVIVQDYDGHAGDDFEVFYREQDAEYVLPGLGVSNRALAAGEARGEVLSRLRGRSFNDRLVRGGRTREKIAGLLGPVERNVLIYADTLGGEQMETPVGSISLTYNLGGRRMSSTRITGGRNYQVPVVVRSGLNFLTHDIPGVGPYTFLLLGR